LAALPGGDSLVGRIAGIDIREGRVSLALSAAPAEASALEPLRRSAEAAIRNLPGVTSAFVSLTAERHEAPPRPEPSPAARVPVSGVRHVVAVASGKGGVGKSTTACNLALALRAEGLRVGLLDADIYGPSAPRLFGLGAAPRVREGGVLEPLDGYGVKVMSIGFLVDPETAMIWRGPMVLSAITQMLREVAWAPLDVLVVDLPPGTGDAQLAIAQATPLSGAVIVSTPQDLALIDARRGIAMFAKLEVPILGLIENMAHFVCDTCGTKHALFGSGGAEAEARRLDVPFLGAVPLTLALRESSDAGRPPVALDPDGAMGRLYRGMARALWQTLGDADGAAVPLASAPAGEVY
jgi:ATP-binding protein involved in chromosome partitioning